MAKTNDYQAETRATKEYIIMENERSLGITDLSMVRTKNSDYFFEALSSRTRWVRSMILSFCTVHLGMLRIDGCEVRTLSIVQYAPPPEFRLLFWLNMSKVEGTRGREPEGMAPRKPMYCSPSSPSSWNNDTNKKIRRLLSQ